MANTLRVKRRASGGAAGAPTSLANAELAYNESDAGQGILYYGLGTGGAGGSATSVISIGGAGAYVNLTSNQTTALSLAISGNKDFTGSVSFGANTTGVTAATADNTTKLSTTAYVQAQGYLTSSTGVTSVALTLPSFITVSGSPITTTGTLAGTLASQTANTVFVAPNGSTGAPTFRSLVAVDIPTLTAVKISDFDTQVRTNRLDQMAAPTANVSFNSIRITSLADPAAAQDAATKAYVDATKQGLDIKESVRVATTADITLSGTQTIDGVAVIAGDRVLVKNQTTASANGLYSVAAGVWARTTDADTSVKVTAGLFVFVEEGTAGADNGFVLTTDNPIAVGTTSLSFTQFSGAGQITAGGGLTKTANTLDVVSTGAGSLTVIADSINLTSGIATAGTYRSLTVDTYGRVTAGTAPTTFAGYGISDTSANLLAAITDETGTGALVFGTSPNLTTPALNSETFSTAATVTAGTNAQGQGALTSDHNVVTVTAANPSGVTLPTATVGRRVLIANRGTNPVNVFPATGATVDGLAINTAISLPVNAVMLFYGASTTQWYSTFNLSNSGSGVTSFTAGTTGLTPSTATTGAISLAGTLVVANGGTGAVTLTGVLKGNGTSAFTAAVDGTDFLSPNATIDGGTF